jgi:hypothetical protein
MLELARKWIERDIPDCGNRINFLPQDITSWSPPEHQFDLIVTHFFLDCFAENQIADVVAKLAHAAQADAAWMLADFCVPPHRFGRVRVRAWLALMYRFFRYTARIEARELIDPSPFLRAARFTLASKHLFRGRMIKSELWRRNS